MCIDLGSDEPLRVGNQCSLELNTSDQVMYFESLDTKHKSFLAQAGPVAYQNKGVSSDHVARYRPLIWTRERDGKKMLNVKYDDIPEVEIGARVVVDVESSWLYYNGARAFATVNVTGVSVDKSKMFHNIVQ